MYCMYSTAVCTVQYVCASRTYSPARPVECDEILKGHLDGMALKRVIGTPGTNTDISFSPRLSCFAPSIPLFTAACCGVRNNVVCRRRSTKFTLLGFSINNLRGMSCLRWSRPAGAAVERKPVIECEVESPIFLFLLQDFELQGCIPSFMPGRCPIHAREGCRAISVLSWVVSRTGTPSHSVIGSWCFNQRDSPPAPVRRPSNTAQLSTVSTVLP
jgi:hypothetical protein